MKNLKDLLKTGNKVWFFIADDEKLRETFSQQVNELGFTFSNDRPLTKDNVGTFMSIRPDGTIAYVSMNIWLLSFDPGYSSQFIDIPKIDYGQYISGTEPYIITE